MNIDANKLGKISIEEPFSFNCLVINLNLGGQGLETL